MPKINETAQEQETTPIPTTVESVIQTIAHTTMPIFICGVNRKVNIGNFENVDVYSAITLPMNVPVDDLEALQDAVIDAAEIGFALTSQETGKRYTLIKEMSNKNKRDSKPSDSSTDV